MFTSLLKWVTDRARGPFSIVRFADSSTRYRSRFCTTKGRRSAALPHSAVRMSRQRVQRIAVSPSQALLSPANVAGRRRPQKVGRDWSRNRRSLSGFFRRVVSGRAFDRAGRRRRRPHRHARNGHSPGRTSRSVRAQRNKWLLQFTDRSLT
jgi:hypothetical protein